jgi:hypothetical protein
MLAVTIGIGPGWTDLAHATAARVRSMTGLPTAVIEADPLGCAHPSWLKCHIPRIFPDHDSFLVFDADLLPVRPWDPVSLFETLGRPFMAVPEPPDHPELVEECAAWHIPHPGVYINAGLLIYGREHLPVLDRAWSYHPNGGSWLEQTALNRALLDEAVEVCHLPRRYNVIAHHGRINNIYCRSHPGEAINLHTCAIGDPYEIAQHHARLEAYIQTGQAGRTRAELLRTLPPGSIGAEIGVFAGDFSRAILQTVRPSTLHLVDLFQGRVISGDKDGRNMREIDMDTMPDRLAALDPCVRVHRSDSAAWLRSQPAHSLDWVYIDADHSYDALVADLAAARHAVRPGGIIAGHDFSRAFPGVLQAVIETIQATGWPCEIYDGDLLPSFALRVPKKNKKNF